MDARSMSADAKRDAIRMRCHAHRGPENDRLPRHDRDGEVHVFEGEVEARCNRAEPALRVVSEAQG
jgi:hypothetical protein